MFSWRDVHSFFLTCRFFFLPTHYHCIGLCISSKTSGIILSNFLPRAPKEYEMWPVLSEVDGIFVLKETRTGVKAFLSGKDFFAS